MTLGKTGVTAKIPAQMFWIASYSSVGRQMDDRCELRLREESPSSAGQCAS